MFAHWKWRSLQSLRAMTFHPHQLTVTPHTHQDTPCRSTYRRLCLCERATALWNLGASPYDDITHPRSSLRSLKQLTSRWKNGTRESAPPRHVLFLQAPVKPTYRPSEELNASRSIRFG